MRALLIGNYGVGNWGDDALRDYFLTAFPEIEWTVVSASARPPVRPERTIPIVPRLPLGFRSLFRPWWRTLRAIARTDAVVFGGGSLFTDSESLFACFLWGMHACVARFFRRPVFLASQGIGPFRTRLGEGIARSVALRSAFLSVRDTASMARVETWGLNKKCIQTFDPVFSSMVKGKLDIRSQNMLSIIPRHNSVLSTSPALAPLLASDWQEIRLILLQGGHVGEEQAVARLQAELPLPAVVRSVATLDDLLLAIGGSKVVLSERFHGALAALAMQIPFIPISQKEGDKLAELVPYKGADAASISRLLALVQQGEHALRSAFALVNADRAAV